MPRTRLTNDIIVDERRRCLQPAAVADAASAPAVAETLPWEQVSCKASGYKKETGTEYVPAWRLYCV